MHVSSSRCLVSFGSDDTTNWCNFVTYIIADRRSSTRQIKEIQSSGNRSLRRILVLRYEKHDRCVSTVSRRIVRWNAVSFFYLIFCLSRFWQNKFLLCTAFVGQCVCMFHPVSDEHRSNQALITYVYINIFVYNIRSVLGITMIDVRMLTCAYLRTDN